MKCSVDNCTNRAARQIADVKGEPIVCRYHCYLLRHYRNKKLYDELSRIREITRKCFYAYLKRREEEEKRRDYETRHRRK